MTTFVGFSARSASGMGGALNTAQPVQREHENGQADVRLPADVLSIILDEAECCDDFRLIKATLRSLALCNKTLHSLAQPRVFGEVRLRTFAQLLHLAYALDLQPRDSRAPLLVRTLQTCWSFEDSTHSPEFQLTQSHGTCYVPLCQGVEIDVELWVHAAERCRCS